MLRLSNSLRNRFIVLVLLCVLPALVLTFSTYLLERHLQITQTRENIWRFTQLAAAREQRLIEGTRQLLIALAQLPEVKGKNRCSQVFRNLFKQYPSYANLAAVEPNGDVFCSAQPLTKRVNIGDHIWFQRVIKVRNFTVGNYQIGSISGKPGIAFSYPVVDSAGEIEAIVYALLDLAWFNQVIAEIELPPEAIFYALDRNGIILARYPNSKQWFGKLVPDPVIIQNILAASEGLKEVRGNDGVLRLYAFTGLSKSIAADVYIAITLEQDNPFAYFNRSLIRNLVLLLLLTASVILIACSVGNRFLIHPINQLVNATKQITSGNFSTRVGLSNSYGELSQLARTFDEMADSLQKQISDRQQAEAEIKQLNQTLEQRVLERTAQLEAANTELDAFSYSVSHDLRAPLRHIRGFVDALEQQLNQSGATSDPKLARYIKVIKNSTQEMQQLIDGLLALSRVGRQQSTSQPVNLRSLVDTAITLVTNPTEHDLTHTREFIIGNLPTVSGDPTLLQQVFTNLIDNAVKFSQDRHPSIIEIGTMPDGTIFVKDNGVGFEMKSADRLFGVFQRLHSQTEFPGTGVGLAIVQRIIQRHGGRIWAESTPNQGATFYFTLS